MQLSVLHYRRRGRRSPAAQIPRQSLRIVPVVRVAGVRVVRVLRRATIRLSFPHLLAGARVRPVIVGGTLRDVVLVVMRIINFIRLRYAELLNLMEARLARGRARVRVRPPGGVRPSLFLFRLSALVFLVLLALVAGPITCVATPFPRGNVVRVILLLPVRMRRRHSGQVILVLRQRGWTAVRVNERRLQGANYRGVVQAAR